MNRGRIRYLLACLAFTVVFSSNAPASSDERPPLPPGQSTMDRWEWDVDHIAKQLPHWETPEERAWFPDPPVLVNDPPPVVPVRNVGEFETMEKVLIRYPLGIPYTIIREMAENVQVSCVVSQSNLATARANFQSNGVDPDAVDWIICASDSYWTRDYGPQFVFDGNGDVGVIDHHYNRPRPNDDLVPVYAAQHWGIPYYRHDLATTGGNYMTDGYGISFSSDLVWDENPSMSHQQIFDHMHLYYGLNTYNILTDDFVSYIRHIDCWAKSLDEETVLVKRVASTHPDYARLEQNATIIASLQDPYGRNYRVVRAYAPSIGGNDVAAYTNSLILNKKVLVPTFNNAVYDAQALDVYRAAMPGYEVLGFYYSGWLTDDALHCRAIGVADRGMLRVAHTPIIGSNAYSAIDVRAFIDDRSEMGLKADSLLVWWRAYPTGTTPPSFTASVMHSAGTQDNYLATIPAQGNGTTVDYYIHAVDNSNRREGRPRCEPAAWYSFNVTMAPSEVADLGIAGGARVRLLPAKPNPFRDQTTFSFELKYADRVSLGVYDVQGRMVRSLLHGWTEAGRHEIRWDGRDASGADAPAGTYFYRLQAGDVSHSRKVVIAD
jgi:agmatine deiminase